MNLLIPIEDVIPHHSTNEWLDNEIELAEAIADDSDEADQKRIIHLNRLRKLLSYAPYILVQRDQRIKELTEALVAANHAKDEHDQ